MLRRAAKQLTHTSEAAGALIPPAEPLLPSLEEEQRLYSPICRFIAGIDEAGRGALAGPVVAAAVLLPLERDCQAIFWGVNDSKQLSASKRDVLFEVIRREATAVGVGIISPEIIDALNIYQATRQAMIAAITSLAVTPQHLLLDAMRLPSVPLPQSAFIKGDARCLSIAAASIVAKVTRDRLLVELDRCYPPYGFARHKGYPTAMHLAALKLHGPCAVHRRSYAPVRAVSGAR